MSRATSKSICCTNSNDPTASSSPDHHGNSKVITCAAVIMLVLIALVIIGSIAIFGIVRPEKLYYEVEDVYVHDYKISEDNHLTATYNITMTAKNNNHRVYISYYDVKMSIECSGDVLAKIGLPPFEQEPRNSTTLYERLYSKNVTLSDKSFGGGCKVSELPQRESGDMKIDVRLTTKIRFKPRSWRFDGRTIRILCFGVKAHFASSHTVQKTKCDVEL